jgi:hypothetical protein
MRNQTIICLWGLAIGTLLLLALIHLVGCAPKPQWHFTDAELEKMTREIKTNSVIGPATFPIK